MHSTLIVIDPDNGEVLPLALPLTLPTPGAADGSGDNEFFGRTTDAVVSSCLLHQPFRTLVLHVNGSSQNMAMSQKIQ